MCSEPSQHKDHLSRYRDSHHKEKIDTRPSYLYNDYSCTSLLASLWYNAPRFYIISMLSVIIPLYVQSVDGNMWIYMHIFNTLRLIQNEQHFADDTFKRIFFYENVWISIKISLKFVPKGPINNIPALIQIMAWCRSGDKPLSEPMMVSLPTHICVTRPQWVNKHWFGAVW